MKPPPAHRARRADPALLRFVLLPALVVALAWLALDRWLESPPSGTLNPEHGTSAAVTDPDFPRKDPARPGDWLHQFEERGQTVEQYKAECVNRRREGRETIVLQPLGPILERHADVMEQVREYVAIYYGCPTEAAEPVEMPAEAFVEERRQYNAARILVVLRNRLPGKALMVAGFCEEDLFAEGLNFVFGLGELRPRVGVYSLARHGDASARVGGEPLFLKRTLKVASHELGHMLGMEHCVRYECNMNGSNSLSETDREPMVLCPECHEKARWNTGFDPAARQEKLAAFYEKVGLQADAAFAARQARKNSHPPVPRSEQNATPE